MADARDDPEIFWVEPRWRAILPLDGFHLSRSLGKVLRRDRFAVTCNAAFDRVLDHCAAPRPDSSDTWISQRIAATYRAMHERGHAHSIECWQAGEDGTPHLAGGLYGVGFDRVFCGESMFSLVPDASKVALAWLVAAMRRGGFELLDCQFMTGHLASLGAIEITQQDYRSRLAEAQRSTFALGEGVGEVDGDALGDGVAGAVPPLAAAFAALVEAAETSSSSPGNFIAQSLTQTS
jgi:leucyl/phenylalanyl-tRNA--protein transferase